MVRAATERPAVVARVLVRDLRRAGRAGGARILVPLVSPCGLPRTVVDFAAWHRAVAGGIPNIWGQGIVQQVNRQRRCGRGRAMRYPKGISAEEYAAMEEGYEQGRASVLGE